MLLRIRQGSGHPRYGDTVDAGCAQGSCRELGSHAEVSGARYCARWEEKDAP